MPERILTRTDGAVFSWTEVLAKRDDMKESIVDSVLENTAKPEGFIAPVPKKKHFDIGAYTRAKNAERAAAIATPQPISDKP